MKGSNKYISDSDPYLHVLDTHRCQCVRIILEEGD